MSIQSCNEPSCFPGNDKSLIATVVVPKPRDLGGFQVRRVLPAIEQRAIGPFVFFDMMGPLTLKTGFELEVRPHPHIGLATLTWLFEGALMHRDSLGSVQVIHPGAVNLMTAGRGIVHSERVSQAGLGLGASVSGAQFWLALPQTEEECDPTFAHYPAATLPMFESEGMTGCVIIGRFNNAISPVSFPHPALCVDLKLATGANLILDDTHAERAIYLVSGAVGCGGERVEEQRLVVFAAGKAVRLQADSAAHILLIAGDPLDGPRHLYWNFVSSRPERIEQAKRDWAAGKFPQVPGESEFIPLP